jgi:hypothetical protein
LLSRCAPSDATASQAAAAAQSQQQQGDPRWWMLLESALACVDRVGMELDFCVFSFHEIADVVQLAMNSNAPLLSARALQVCASFADDRAVSAGRGISKDQLAPLLSVAVQRTTAEHEPPVRVMAIQTVGSFLQRTKPEDVVELLPQLLNCLWPLAQSWTNASQVAVYDTLFACYRMTMVLSRTRGDVAVLVQGQAGAVLQHCMQQFVTHGDMTSRDTVMKLSQVKIFIVAIIRSRDAAVLKQRAAGVQRPRLLLRHRPQLRACIVSDGVSADGSS